jgi:hypothetical protein
MKDIIVEIGTSVVCLILATLGFYVAKIVHVKCEQLKTKTDSEALRALIEKVDYIIQTCVEATNQTFVDDLKNSNAFTEENKKEAMAKTFEAIQNMLTDDDKQKIMNNFGDVSTYLNNSVENYIKTSKIENIDIPL